MAFLDENGVAQFWAAVKDRLAGAFDNVEFDVAEQAANLVSGDSIATAFGKLAKNYSSLLTSISDLNTTLGNRISEVNTNLTNQINTKLNKSDVLANYTTTATGKALDASLGPAIKSKMDLADTLDTKVNNMNTANYRLYTSSNGTVEYGTWNTIADIDIPADDTHVWLVLGMSYDNISEDHIAAMKMILTPDTAGIMGLGRFAGKIGAGMNCWGIVNPGVDTARTVSLQVYGYRQTAYIAYGRLYGIAICDTRS